MSHNSVLEYLCFCEIWKDACEQLLMKLYAMQSGVMDENVQLGLLAAWMALFGLFASRKFTQPIKDDIGDKSVFMFNALPEDKQQALLQRLQLQQSLQKDRSG